MIHVKRAHTGPPARFDGILKELTGLAPDQVALIVAMGGAYVGKLRCKQVDRPIRKGEVVSAWYRLPLDMQPIPFQTDWVLTDNGRYLVAAKPAGLPTQGRRDADYLAFFEILRNNLAGYLGLHHRLDQDTSGLMLFTRHRDLNGDVARAFRDHLVRKSYLAVCRGTWPFAEEQIVLHEPIAARRLPSGTRQEVNQAGKRATTRIRRLHRWADRVLVEAEPQTGRTHQIRVHLAHQGLPLAGDKLYGGGDGRFLLHCFRLAWPAIGRLPEDSFRLAVPDDWRQLGPEFEGFYDDWWRSRC